MLLRRCESAGLNAHKHVVASFAGGSPDGFLTRTRGVTGATQARVGSPLCESPWWLSDWHESGHLAGPGCLICDSSERPKGMPEPCLTPRLLRLTGTHKSSSGHISGHRGCAPLPQGWIGSERMPLCRIERMAAHARKRDLSTGLARSGADVIPGVAAPTANARRHDHVPAWHRPCQP